MHVMLIECGRNANNTYMYLLWSGDPRKRQSNGIITNYSLWWIAFMDIWWPFTSQFMISIAITSFPCLSSQQQICEPISCLCDVLEWLPLTALSAGSHYLCGRNWCHVLCYFHRDNIIAVAVPGWN